MKINVEEMIEQYIPYKKKELEEEYSALTTEQKNWILTSFENQLIKICMTKLEEWVAQGEGYYTIQSYVWRYGRWLWDKFIEQYNLNQFYEISFEEGELYFHEAMREYFTDGFNRRFAMYAVNREKAYFEAFHEKNKKINLEIYKNLLGIYITREFHERSKTVYQQEFKEKRNERAVFM